MVAHNDNYARVSHELVIRDRHNRMLGYTTRVIDKDDAGRLSVVVAGRRLDVKRDEQGEHSITLVL
jgi:hypothetical protein